MKDLGERDTLIKKWFTPEYLNELENKLQSQGVVLPTGGVLSEHVMSNLFRIAKEKESANNLLEDAMDTFIDKHVIEFLAEGLYRNLSSELCIDGDFSCGNKDVNITFNAKERLNIINEAYTATRLIIFFASILDSKRIIDFLERNIRTIEKGIVP
jgi:hypothetical protein